MAVYIFHLVETECLTNRPEFNLCETSYSTTSAVFTLLHLTKYYEMNFCPCSFVCLLTLQEQNYFAPCGVASVLLVMSAVSERQNPVRNEIPKKCTPDWSTSYNAVRSVI
jgi:hypothetical protein